MLSVIIMNEKMPSKRSSALSWIGLLCLCLVTAIRFFDSVGYWLLDMLSHFAVQYALVALIMAVIFYRTQKTAMALASCLLFVVNISVLTDIGKFAQAAGHTNSTFTVYSANINKTNTEFAKLRSVFMETDSDILLLLEVMDKHIDPLQPLIDEYPYQIVNLNVGSSGTGTVLLSKFPVLEQSVTKYSEFGNMLISATLEINKRRVSFYAAHFPRPRFGQQFSAREKQFVSLAREIEGLSTPVIVAGDLNAAPYSPLFENLIMTSGLRDSRAGFGWLPSWPAYCPPCWLPLDHILVSQDVHVVNRAVGSYIGSDHFPVYAELSL